MCQISHDLEYLKEPFAFSTVLRAHVKQPFTAFGGTSSFWISAFLEKKIASKIQFP